MKLTLQIKLLANEIQAEHLKNTLKEANAACNYISDMMWKNRVWNQFKTHTLVYYNVRERFNLSAQMVVRCIGKTTDAYKLDHKKKRKFKTLGSIAYDSRILSYKKGNIASLWTTDGRQKIPFVCHNPKYLPYVKGEADLVFKKGKWFLFQTVDVPENNIKDVEDFLGIDFGIINIATTSDGVITSGKTLNQYREKRQRIRSSIQAKGTRSARRLLQRLSGKEKKTASIVNHTIAKHIVKTAKDSNRGIVLEKLKGIRQNGNKKGKTFRSRLSKWSFYQLKEYIAYKAKMLGIPVVFVDPRYSSQTCSQCYRIGSRKGESFKCSCGYFEHADKNAARNIRTLGLLVNQPEKSTMFCMLRHS